MNPDFIKFQQEVEREIHQVWSPHNGQIPIVSAFFVEWLIGVFARCGRKFGKTELAIYCMYMFGILFENSELYYIADEKEHARDICWDNGRLPRFFTSFKRMRGESNDDFWERRRLGNQLQQKYIAGIRNDTMTVRLTNGSILKVDGAKNWKSADGLSPLFIVYDEFKNHDPRFDLAMRPNMQTYDGRIFIIGTPPDNEENYYCETEKEFEHKPGHMHIERPCYMNNHVYPKGIDDPKVTIEEEAYRRKGEWHVFAREYLAKIVPDQKRMIFPMLDHRKHVLKYDDMIAEIKKNFKRWDFYIHFDPGTTSVFAVLLIAINKYDKRVWLLDEIYEKNQMETTSKKIWNRSVQAWREVHPYDDDWYKGYDSAAAWFQTEIAVEFDEAIFPCNKGKNKGTQNTKEDQLSVIKDALIWSRYYFSDRVVETFKEYQNHKKDDKGMIPKENDHNIDNSRYILKAANYETKGRGEPKKESELSEDRYYTPDQDMRKELEQEFLMGGISELEYDYYLANM